MLYKSPTEMLYKSRTEMLYKSRTEMLYKSRTQLLYKSRNQFLDSPPAWILMKLSKSISVRRWKIPTGMNLKPVCRTGFLCAQLRCWGKPTANLWAELDSWGKQLRICEPNLIPMEKKWASVASVGVNLLLVSTVLVLEHVACSPHFLQISIAKYQKQMLSKRKHFKSFHYWWSN